MSSFNAKSSPVPAEWQDLEDDWLKKMGYRFVLRRITWPIETRQNGKVPYTTWWENKGVAPCYNDFPVGPCEVQVAIVDRMKHEPRVNLAIEGKDSDGWYHIGKISITK